MMHSRTRLLAAGCLAAAAAVSAGRLTILRAATGSPQTTAGPRVEISFTQGARAEPVTGMVYLAISKTNQNPPITDTDTDGVPLFSKYVEELRPGAAVTIGAADRGHPVASLRDIPAGDYWIQPFVNVYTRFRARRRPHGLDAHGPVGRPELEAVAGQSLRRPGEDAYRSDVERRRSRWSPTR